MSGRFVGSIPSWTWKIIFSSEFFFPHISFYWYFLRIIIDNVNINIPNPNVHIIPTLFYDIFHSKSGKFALKNQDNFIIIRNHFLYKNLLFLWPTYLIKQCHCTQNPFYYFYFCYNHHVPVNYFLLFCCMGNSNMGNSKVVVLFLFDGPENTRLNKI